MKVAPDAVRGDPTINGRAVDGAAVHFDERNVTAEWADCPGCPRCEKTDGLVLRRGSGRPSKSTERVLLFVKGPGYYWDSEAVREPNTEGSIARFANDPHRVENKKYAGTAGISPAGMNATEWRGNGRNLRDAWTIGPEPLKAKAGESEHYAAYPSRLPERCILAGTSEWGCCPSCGAPWARVVDSRFVKLANRLPTRKALHAEGQMADVNSAEAMGYNDVTTLGWRPTCVTKCPGVAEQAPVPCRVLDPFGGSGTTALAANRLGRDCTLVELKPGYADLARKRLGREPLSLWAWQGQEALEPAGEEAAPLEKTKQEAHPNRTVAGFNQRYRATALAKQALEEDGA